MKRKTANRFLLTFLALFVPAAGLLGQRHRLSLTHLSLERRLSQASVYAVVQDRKGSSGPLWIGTYGGGLNRFESASGALRHFRERDGFPTTWSTASWKLHSAGCG